MVLDRRKSNSEIAQRLQLRIWFTMAFYYKMRQMLLQHATFILLQNPSDCLLQNATVITRCICYYKVRRYRHVK